MRKIGYIGAAAVFAAALMIPAGAAAAAPTEVIRTQLVSDRFNTCSGELVTFTGEATIWQKTLADGSNKITLLIRGEGTGESGNEYIVHVNSLLVFDPSVGFVLEDDKITLVSKGSAPNESLRIHSVLGSPDNTFEITCRG
ncbi:hypothetical protein [Salinibacterium sp. ZJ450]|uniref:hypothetical protein n=1 Tax=Salinibacterium sp. ZJ450 TaxID=2708338 RepID=UPI0014239CD2|nr:hypothetical protein [Salinibacterium sp. ZJ450]